jgi:hypothetical protein
MRKALPLLVLAALPALLLTGCSGAQPDPVGYTNAVITYTDLNGPAVAAGQQSHLQQTVLERGRQTCALLGKGETAAAAQTRLTLATARTTGGDSDARAALEWYELNAAADYLCPEHAALAKRIAAAIPGFGGSSSVSSDRLTLTSSTDTSSKGATPGS